jgi:glyoxylase-like metal-dependent hydrolase (beta-lactamase superfamily II)
MLRAGPIKLDGGGMFGLIPRIVWSKSITPDDRHRITLSHNCLLLTRTDEHGKTHRILIETGSGDKLDPKMRDIFGITDYTIIEALRDAQCQCEEIDHVIVSHLHFDHAGGLTRRVRAGETPDWTDHHGIGVKLTFPNARVISQKQEWHDALANNSVMTRTYYRDHLDPIRKQIELVDSPSPFANRKPTAPPWDSSHPNKDALPNNSVLHRLTPVLPGISVFRVPGHTWGQQAILFTDNQNRTIIFTPDILPTIHHVGAAYNLAYDVEPYISTLTRRWFLEEAVTNDWLLYLDHEPANPLVRVKSDGKGWYKLEADIKADENG